MIKAVHISEGDLVHPGEVLFELDPTFAAADNNESTAKQKLSVNRIRRLEAEVSNDGLVALPNAPAEKRGSLESMLMKQRLGKLNLQLDQAEREAAKAKANTEATRKELEIAIADRGNLSRKLLALEPLVGESITKKDYDDLADQLRRAELTIQLKQATLESSEAALTASRDQKDIVLREHAIDVFSQLTEQQNNLATTNASVVKSNHGLEILKIISTTTGIVQRMGSHTAGTSLAAGQTVAVIAPVSNQLIVEARANAKDAGFIKVGQPVDVKIDTYPYVKYGSVTGKVEWVSPDSDSGSLGSPHSEETKNELDSSISRDGYSVKIAIDLTSFRSRNDQQLPISPGMSVQVDVITESRTILGFFLSPIVRAVHDSVRLR